MKTSIQAASAAISFTTACAQGDVHFTRIDALPAGLTKVEPKGGRVLVTHSETGHDHVMAAAGVSMFEDPANPLRCFLLVEHPTDLVHLRGHDTHAPIMFQPGTYEVRRQREYTPEGFRRVED